MSNHERETIINYNEGEPTASIYTHSKALRRKLDKLSTDRPEACRLLRVSHDGQAAEFIVPKGWIRINPPRQISQSQREQMRERAKIAFSSR